MPVLTLLRRLLLIVLEGTELSLSPELGTLRFLAEGAHVPAADLPDGFRTTVAWLADLCAAWYAKAPEEALTGEPHSPSSEPAFAILERPSRPLPPHPRSNGPRHGRMNVAMSPATNGSQ